MRRWLWIASFTFALGCAAEDDAPADSVSASDGDGGDRVIINRPPSGGSSSGDGDGDKDRDGSTDEPEGTPLSELTESELGALCDDVKASFDDALSRSELDSLICMFSTLAQVMYVPSGDVVIVNGPQCEDLLSSCVESSDHGFRCETEAFATAASECDGTAESFRACAEVSARAYGSAVGELTCDNLSSASDVEDAFRAWAQLDPFAHPGCVALASDCPDLFGDATRGEPAEDGCDETCGDSDDGWCDDGGPDSQTSLCPLGTDCLDCGER